MRNLTKTLLIGGAALVPALSSAQAQLTYGRPVAEALTTVQYIISLLNIILPSAAVILFFLVIAAYLWGKLRGQEVVKGTTILYSLIAVTVLFATYGLVRLMAAFVGVNTDGSTRITAPALPTQAR